MGHLGFSYIGLIFLLMLMIPNLIWTKYQPEGYEVQGENKVLLVFERAGQVLVTCTALIFSDLNLHKWSVWPLWFIAAGIFMCLYEVWWIRYFKSRRTLPVTAFFLLGVYENVAWLLVSTVILGVGHIGIHLQHYKEIRREGLS